MEVQRDSKDHNNLLEYKWMLRFCDTYYEEYSDCTSIRARFHQYFVHGKTKDCNNWKTDYDNCVRWTEDGNQKAYADLIASEQKRRLERLAPHYRNDVWKKRSAPPEGWDKPLPAWLEEENKASYLRIKADELKNNGRPVEGERKLCVIS